jgi:hypothetical protein
MRRVVRPRRAAALNGRSFLPGGPAQAGRVRQDSRVGGQAAAEARRVATWPAVGTPVGSVHGVPRFPGVTSRGWRPVVPDSQYIDS